MCCISITRKHLSPLLLFQTEVKPKIHAATTQHKDLLDEYQKTKWTTDLLKKLCSVSTYLVYIVYQDSSNSFNYRINYLERRVILSNFIINFTTDFFPGFLFGISFWDFFLPEVYRTQSKIT